MKTKMFTKQIRHIFTVAPWFSRIVPGLLGSILLLGPMPFALATDFTWNGLTSSDWEDTANWDQPGIPDNDGDRVAISGGTDPRLGANRTVGEITISGNGDLYTNGYRLTVDPGPYTGDIQLEASVGASSLYVDNSSYTWDVSARNLYLHDNALVDLRGSGLLIDDQLYISSGGKLTGDGTVRIGGNINFSNYGELEVTGGTMTIEKVSGSLAWFDWDGGAGGTALTDIRSDSTLVVNMAPSPTDPYDGTIAIGKNGEFQVNSSWELSGFNFAGILELDGSVGTATVSGSSWEMSPTGTLAQLNANTGTGVIASNLTMTNGTTTVASGATLQFDGTLTANGGTIVNNDLMVFNNTVTINSGVDFQMTGNDASITVADGKVATIHDADFNLGGGKTHTNVSTIGVGARLDVNMDFSSGGGDLLSHRIDLTGGELEFNETGGGGDTQWHLSNADVNALASGTHSRIDGSDLLIQGATTIDVDSGAILVIETSDAGITGGTMNVEGDLNFNTSTLWTSSSVTVSGSGTFRPGLATIGSGTVATDLVWGVSTVDWDDSNQTIAAGSSLTINADSIEAGVADGFDMTLTLESGTVTVNTPDTWKMEGTANLNNTGGGDPTINGARMSVGDANGATVNVTGGDAVIGAPLTVATNGTIDIATGARLIANGNTIYDGGLITGVGTYLPPSLHNNTVTSDTTIDVDTFDFDRGHWAVDPEVTLTVSVDDYDLDTVNDFDFWTTLNSGAINASSADAYFLHDGNLELVNTTGVAPIWSGDPLYFGGDVGTLDANLNVRGTGVSRISSSITFFSDADVFIEPDAILQTGRATFESVNGAQNAEFTGAGTWRMVGTNTVNEATVINMVGGSVDLDNSSILSLGANDTHVNADLTINVETMSSYGAFYPGGGIFPPSNTDLNIADLATLTVNLDDPTAEWTVNSNGIVNYNGNATADWFLAGSDLNMAGTLNVAGLGYCDARVDISGTVNVATSGKFRMTGGDLGADPNWLLGGTINGPGLIGAADGSALVGYGTINADVDFDVQSHLYADNGTLVVNGAILDVNNVGTADNDGVLNVVNNWNSNVAWSVQMAGGELTGGDITVENVNGILGHGLVSARVINNNRLMARNSGEKLVVETPGNDNDWDGNDTPEVGLLVATGSGTLEIRDNVGFAFNGTVNANGGGAVFVNGFQLSMQSTSTLSLAAGVFKHSGSAPIPILGTVDVGMGTSTLLVSGGSGGFRFGAGSLTTLTGDLQFDTPDTEIESGASFTGGGKLINLSGATLTLADGAIVGVQLDNEGDLDLGASPGQATGRVFTQGASGTLHIEIAGTNPSQIDSLAITSSAQLGGTLDLTLLGGFTPTLGQTFTIMTFLSRTHEFSTVNQPPTMPAGLEFDVIYDSTNVQLEVVASSTSFSDWIDSFVTLTDPADKTKTADPDDDGMNNLTEFALDGDPTTGVVSGKIVGKIAPVGGTDALTLTFPVRTGALETGPAGGELTLAQTSDGVIYTVQASDDLSAFTVTVTEVTGADATAIQAGLPALSSGDWEYRSFRSAGPVAGDPVEFMRVLISE